MADTPEVDVGPAFVVLPACTAYTVLPGILPVGTVETAVAAILRRSGVAAVVVVEAGLALHKAFKGAVAAGCEIHGVASFLNLGVKKAASFSPIRGSENAASAVSYSILV